MSPIKIVLLIPLLAIAILFVLQLRNKTFYRATLIVLMLVGIVFVLDPDLTTAIAHMLNVGRGADLLFYVCIIAGICVTLIFYSKIRSIEEQQTAIIREQALAQAQKRHPV